MEMLWKSICIEIRCIPVVNFLMDHLPGMIIGYYMIFSTGLVKIAT